MRIRMSAAIVALSLILAGTAFAQATSGTIAGRLTDSQDLAIPGATITVTGPQGSKSFVSDEQGRFSAPFLTPGTYQVRAELQGFKAFERSNIVVGVGQTVELPIEMQVGGLTETVEVSGASPVVDTRTTTTGGVLDPETLQRLPVGRNLTDTLYVLPGVSDSSGAGRANPSIGGASGLENNYIVDGVNITDTGFGGFGAFNSTYLSLGMGVTSDFVKETQVKTGGFEAEYGESTGGVVNVVTKSGSNRFSGSVFGYTRPSAVEADWDELVTPNGTVNTTGTTQSDAGVSLGGAVVQNRLFFFGTYNPQWQNRTFIAPEGFPYRSLGEVDRERRIHSYAGKLTAQASPSHRFDFSVFGDPSKGLAGLQNPTALRRIANPGVPGTSDIRGGYSELEYGGHNQTLRYDGVMSPNWLVEGAIAHATNKFFETPTVNEWAFTDLRTVPQGRSGGLGFFENNDGSNVQYSVKSTNMLNAGGQHQLKYGLQVQDINFLRGTNYSGPGLLLSNGLTTITGGPVQIRRADDGSTFYRATRGLLAAPGRTTQLYTSVFIQDTWQTGRLTIVPGVRWERQYLEGPTPGGADNYPALCFEGDTRPGAGDGTGNAIPCSYAWNNNWAPRIGVTYDLTGNGTSKVYGSWGRFYAKVPNDLAVRAMGTDSGITRQDYFDAALTRPIPNGVYPAGGSTTHLQRTSDHAAIIEPGTGGAYTDEIIAGIEFEALPGSSVGVRYIRRTMPQILEDIGQLPIAGYFEDEVPVDYFITNPSRDTTVVQCCGFDNASFEDPVHDYDAVEVVLNRRFNGRWSAIASYRFSRLRGNFEGFFRSDNGQNDPAISSLYDFPTNDPSYTAVGVPELGFVGDIRYQGATLGAGRLPNDRPHQVKLFGSYMFADVNIGMGFTAGSGRVLTALAANPVYNNAGEIPMTIRGEGFETVDGFKKRAPMDAQLDLHADYRPEFLARRLTFIADVFNVFNRQTALDYDNWYETAFGTLNPNFGHPTNGGGSSTPSYQAPFGLRLGVRYDW